MYRRSIRFHRFKLRSCHSLLDGATFLNGKEGPDGESEFAIAGDDAVSTGTVPPYAFRHALQAHRV